MNTKAKWFLLCCMAALCSCFVACSDSEENETTGNSQSQLDGAWRLKHVHSEWHWTDEDGVGKKDRDRDNEVLIFNASTQQVIVATYEEDKDDRSWSVSEPSTYSYDPTTKALSFRNRRNYYIESLSKDQLVLRKEDVQSQTDYRYDTYTYSRLTNPAALLGRTPNF